MTSNQESALKKSEKLIEIVRGGSIESPFKVEGGTCYNYDLYVEGTIAQLKGFEVLSLYWKTAYMRLYRLKIELGL